jgi:leucyl-tRNA synthetase
MVTFPVTTAAGEAAGIEVFTTRPDTLFGATFMVLAPEHPLVDAGPAGDWPEGAPKPAWRAPAAAADPGRGGRGIPAPPRARAMSSGRWTTGPRPASSPAPSRPTRSTATRFPVFVADYVLMGYGTGAIMAVPAGDQRDYDYATEFDLPIIVVAPVVHQAGRARSLWGTRSPVTGRRSTRSNDDVSTSTGW